MLSVVLSRPEKKKGLGFCGGRVALLRCTKDIVAQKNSKNHRKGDIYKKYTTLNSLMYRNQMTRYIFPKIKSDPSILAKSERFASNLMNKAQNLKLPAGCKWADIYIQVDNAPPHCKRNKRLYSQIVKAAGRNIVKGKYYGPKLRLIYQPPDSPDLNVLDLGFFEKFWTRINNILKKNTQITSLNQIWEAAKTA